MNGLTATTPAVAQSTGIEALPADAKPAEIVAKVNELIAKVNSVKVRDRGPKSERSMTDEDAWRVKFGDLKGMKHKEAAAACGLSYGQVYSARGEYTFTHVKADSFTETASEKADPKS